MVNQSILQAMITEQTCGDACWHAKEDICRCSCGGRNHGILRTADGERPERTRKIKGAMYQLIAVSPAPEVCECAHDAYEPIDNLHRTIENRAIERKVCTFGDIYYAQGYRMEHLPVFTKTASDGEIERWPELAIWRNSGKWFKPLTLWLRVDFISLKD